MWHIALIVVAAVLSMQSCGHNELPGVIVSNKFFTLTGDSLVMRDTTVWSVDGTTIKARISDIRESQISFHTTPDNPIGQIKTKYHLVDALSAMSVQTLRDTTRALFHSHSDLYDAIGLTLAYTAPRYSKRKLREMVNDGVVTGNQNSYYPAFDNRMAWTAAAWRVYLATGDREWLKYAYAVSVATFEQEQEIAFYKRDWLVRGCPGDYTPLVEALPTWMEHSDVFSTFTLSNNVETAQALDVMSEMAAELDEDGTRYAQLARDLKDAVNHDLWNEKYNQYTALIYGQSCTLHAPCCDNRAQALAVMWGLADLDDRASRLIENTKVTVNGVNNFFPATGHSTEPCINERSWALTQGMWNLASAHVDNENALRHGLAALFRAQALYCTSFVGGGNDTLTYAAAVSNVAMTHRLMMGMNFVPDGIEFSPVIPLGFGGDKRLTGFAYRGATLDITVKGCGHEVESMQVDGKPVNGTFVPAQQLKGHHTVIITMKEGYKSNQGINIEYQSAPLPHEPEVIWDGDSAHIYNFDPSLAYKLIIDGNRTYTINDSTFAVPRISNFSELAVAATNNRYFSYSSRPFITGGRRFQVHPIAMGDAGNDTITVHVTVQQAGDYMMSINYTNPSTQCDARIITANTYRQGVTLLGGLGTDNEAGQSNLIHVDLLQGSNTITIETMPSLHGQARPISINVFKKN